MYCLFPPIAENLEANFLSKNRNVEEAAKSPLLSKSTAPHDLVDHILNGRTLNHDSHKNYTLERPEITTTNLYNFVVAK